MSLFYILLGVAIGAAVFMLLCVCCICICGPDMNQTSMLVIQFLTCGCCGRGKKTRIHPQHHETYGHASSAGRPLVVVNTAKDATLAQEQREQILRGIQELKEKRLLPVADEETESDAETDSDTDKSDSEPSKRGFLTLPSLSSLKLK